MNRLNTRDVMSRDLRTIHPTASVPTAARMMREHGVGSLPVVEHGRLCGMLTDRDLVVRVLATGKDPHATHVEEVMTSDCAVVSETSEVNEVALVMQRYSVRRVPVVDEEGSLVGIVSLADLATLEDARRLSGDVLIGMCRGL